MSEANLMSACAQHGVSLSEEHVAIVGKLGDGTILKNLLALIEKYGPELATVMPEILADLAAGNYLGAITLILSTLAAAKPTTP